MTDLNMHQKSNNLSKINRIFPPHFELASELNLPMYLHSRAAEYDFINIMKQNLSKIPGGVVHSFTGSLTELKSILDMGLYIGVNGCSLKTKENINVVKEIPLDKIMLES